MNWEAIGSIAELVAAIAVILTLLYLSLQIRDARRASIADGSSKGMELHSNWRIALIENSDVASVVAKANKGEELTEKERVQMQFFSDELFFSSVISQVFGEHSGAFYRDGAYAEYLANVLKTNPGLIPEWRRFRDSTIDMVSVEFGKEVDLQLSEIMEKDA